MKIREYSSCDMFSAYSWTIRSPLVPSVNTKSRKEESSEVSGSGVLIEWVIFAEPEIAGFKTRGCDFEEELRVDVSEFLVCLRRSMDSVLGFAKPASARSCR